jgi:D-glycerate 3-kinase
MTDIAAALPSLGLDPARVERLYAPIGAWLDGQLAASARRPFVLGVSGPQGCGKSTLASALVDAIVATGRRAVAISIDDFYLRRDEQLALAARHPGDRALEHRGHPGTHDVALGEGVLASLRDGHPTTIPRYDKSAHEGRGDRAPGAAWTSIDARLDVVILEGWMVGFAPLDSNAIAPELAASNALLGAYAAWWRCLDAIVVAEAASLSSIVRWRVDAERARRARGEAGLSDADALDYIERFLPAYRAWVPPLVARPPCRRVVTTKLGDDRMPIAMTLV